MRGETRCSRRMCRSVLTSQEILDLVSFFLVVSEMLATQLEFSKGFWNVLNKRSTGDTVKEWSII